MWPEEPEYVVHSGPPSAPPTSFGAPYADAPDPFAPPSDPKPENKSSGKRWIIPVASLVVLAVVAAAVYFLFFNKDDKSTHRAEGEPTTSSATESGSASSESSPSSGSAEAAIAGTFEVNGTIESYTGPPLGQLGAPPKSAGSAAFTKPQTWTIADCTDTTCTMTISPGDQKVELTLEDGVWTGEATGPIACNAATGVNANAALTFEIPEAGGTAKRTLSAMCTEAITEVDTLTLTAK